MPERITFDKYLILLAHVAKLRSQDQFRRIGAVCASKDNRIIATGYNGLASGFEPPKNLYLNRENPLREKITYHGELNALMLCKKGDVYTMALTCSPCQNCSKMIAAYGVKRVIFSEIYEREQSFKEIFDFYQIPYIIISMKEIESYIDEILI